MIVSTERMKMAGSQHARRVQKLNLAAVLRSALRGAVLNASLMDSLMVKTDTAAMTVGSSDGSLVAAGSMLLKKEAGARLHLELPNMMQLASENSASSGTIIPGMDIISFSVARRVTAQAFLLLVLTMTAPMTNTVVSTPAMREAMNVSAETKEPVLQLLNHQTRLNRQQQLRSHLRAAATPRARTGTSAWMVNAQTLTSVWKKLTIAIPSNNALIFLANSDAILEKSHVIPSLMLHGKG
jgi:hypothetical protein